MRQLMAVLLAVVLTVGLFGTIYVVAQQLERQGADDVPQRLASQVAAELRTGSTETVDGAPAVDLGRSLAPFVEVVTRSGEVSHGTAMLDGVSPALPSGVLAAARREGSDAVTWQPRAGLRFATVELAVGSRVVVAGQSLAPNESRTEGIGLLILIAWAVTSLVAAGGIYLVTWWRTVV